jgi:hypothetical protein
VRQRRVRVSELVDALHPTLRASLATPSRSGTHLKKTKDQQNHTVLRNIGDAEFDSQRFLTPAGSMAGGRCDDDEQ